MWHFKAQTYSSVLRHVRGGCPEITKLMMDIIWLPEDEREEARELQKRVSFRTKEIGRRSGWTLAGILEEMRL